MPPLALAGYSLSGVTKSSRAKGLIRFRRLIVDQAPRMAFSHIGLYVGDMSRMVSFHTNVLGFSVTAQACIREADVVFLSRNPDVHHQIVLVPGRAA